MIFMGKRSTAHTDRKKEDRKTRIEDQFADKPTAQADSDRLDFKRIVSFLADFISDDDKRRTITTIGIYGEWGSGKTSFLKMLDERLRNEKQIYPIWFYAWRYDKQDDLWAALLQSILNQAGKLKGQNLLRKWWIKFRIWFRYKSLGEGTWEVTRKFMLGGLRIFVILIILFVLFYITFGVGGPSIATFLQMIPFLKTVPSNVLILIVNAFLVFLGAATADVGKIRDLLVGGIQVDFTKFERKSNFRDRISLLDEFSRELQDLIDLLRPPKKPLVVIIDDLDRCLPESALRVLESIKVFLENSNCIFLLGLDKQVLERAVAERYKESSSTDHNQPDTRSGMDAHQRKYHLEYFDKIIPLAIAVPQMLQTQNAIKDFITKLNSGIDKEVEEYADIFGFSLSTNPRKIKRTLSSFRFVRDLVNARIEAQEASNAEKNIRFSLLAKLITIQSQFPDLYESAIREPSLLEDLETHFRNPDLQTSEKAAYAESYANKYQGLREILIRGKNKDKEDSFVGQSIHNYAFQIGTLAEVGLSVRKQSLQNEIFWKIPGRNELFTAREVILHSLRDTFEQRLESHNACIALSGSYGIGKTQIAIEYAHRYRQDYKAVFWVHAETRNMMMIDYGAIAEYVELPEKNEQNQNLVNEAVKTWFERQTNWLLILDGVDDLSQVNDLLPHLSNGHILLTTRQQYQDAAIMTMVVDTLAEQESQLLLLRRAKKIGPNSLLTDASDSEDLKQARELAQLLGGLPLVLDQAGAYIEQTGCDLQECFKRYQSGRNDQLSQLGIYDAEALIWSLSRERLKHKSLSVAQAAENLLQLSALLDTNEIPIELFLKNSALLESIFRPVATFDVLLNAVLEELENFALARRSADMQTLSIPGLLLANIRAEMGEHISREQVENVILLVSRAFPEKVDISTWKDCQRYLAQALACAHLVQRCTIDTLEAAQLLDRAGRYLRERAQYSTAEGLLKSACGIYTNRLEAEHPDTLATLNALALLYQAQRRYAEAEELMLRVQQIYEKKQEPLDVATSLSNLASLYNAQYRYTDAEPRLRRALEIRQKRLGEDHLDVATTKNELGLTCLAQSRYDEAETLLKSALVIRQRVLKEDDPDVATTKSILADLYQALSRYNEAEPLLQEALSIREKALGKDHADVAITLSNLATLYYEQDRYEEAEPLFKQALDILKKLRKEDDPDVAAILNNLGRLYYNQARYKESEPLIKQALDILQKALEEDDSQLIAIQWLYVSLLRQVKKEQEAAALEKHIRQIQESAQQERG